MGSSSQENGSGKKAQRKGSDTGESLGLLGNEDLSSLFANSLTAPAPTQDSEPEGEEIYNSGELDLRSMADAYFRERAGTVDEVDESDEVPMLSPSEILIPSAEERSGVRGLPIAIAAVLGLFLIAGTVLATLLIMGRGDANEAEAQPVAAAEQVEAAPAPAPAEPAPVALAEPAAEPEAEPEMVFEPQPAVEQKRERATDDEESREARRERREQREAAKAESEREDGESRSRIDVLAEMRANKQAEEPPEQPAAEPAPAPAPAKPKCDEVACLVNPSDPCCAKLSGAKREAKAEKAAASDLPEKLTSADVNAGIGKIRGRIGACGTKHGFQGVAKFKLTIAGDGSVSSAKVDAGNAEFKSCVGDKLDGAKFKKTQQGLTVTYPFVFR